ncbi:translation initiation factor IF1A [Ordospora colligata]|uniref:Translation initiation factor IF1A n=1 Tax=Ordospora colligata OC4 TaxID=1354746 RepID=A0A0B2UFV5_9MICR|nr:translation initiation factor IF1A [Ordospora colligata OC4]KHN69966.1 translation initiation factor IF1A [Ordospora colligata OC4]TBU16136.1 translation initiation factor IF1A [Ordospora colligata]TBU16349.1 translation initiation factor IF1A [Ordospora colligata]TBU19053.1 translation initiation factor IF1A [Ordospora colligata]
MGGKRGDKSGDRALAFAEEEQTTYGQIIAPLGQCMFRVNCSDGVARIAKIRGRDYRRVRMGPGDIVLLRIRDGDDKKADIDRKYMPKEIKILKDDGEIKDDTFSIDDQGFALIDFEEML